MGGHARSGLGGRRLRAIAVAIFPCGWRPAQAQDGAAARDVMGPRLVQLRPGAGAADWLGRAARMPDVSLGRQFAGYVRGELERRCRIQHSRAHVYCFGSAAFSAHLRKFGTLQLPQRNI